MGHFFRRAKPTEGMLVCEGTHDLRAQVVLQERCPDVPGAKGIDPQTLGDVLSCAFLVTVQAPCYFAAWH